MRYSIIGATVDQVKNAGGTDIKESRNTGIIFATLTEGQAARLRSLGFTVSKVGDVKTQVMPPTPIAAVPLYSAEQLFWLAGLEQLRSLTQPPLYGEGMNVAVIGSGVRETHELIQGRVVYRKNLTSAPMADDFNHDTGVASIIVSIAPKCNILNMKVLDEKGNGTEEEVVMALDDILSLSEQNSEYAPTVVNLSLGGPDDGNPNNPMRVACRAVIDRGIWIVAAAGNGGPAAGTITSPACERYVGAIGSAKYLASERSFAISDFSSCGPTREGLTKPDALFFGEDIVMASSQTDTTTIAKSGTSFSTPFMAGLVLLYHESLMKYPGGAKFPGEVPPGMYRELPLLSVQELLDTYLGPMCGKPAGAPAGKDDTYGYGMPLGALVLTALGIVPTVDYTPVITGLTGILTIAIMGVMMKNTVGTLIRQAL